MLCVSCFCLCRPAPPTATGVLLSWDIAGVPVQAKERRSSRALEASDDTVGSDGEEGEIYLGKCMMGGDS